MPITMMIPKTKAVTIGAFTFSFILEKSLIIVIHSKAQNNPVTIKREQGCCLRELRLEL